MAHYTANATTKRTFDDPELSNKIKAIESQKGLPDDVKRTAIEGLRASAKQPTGAVIHDAAKAGDMPLVCVLGPHSPKRMSHNVVRNIAQHAEFFIKYLEEVHANYDG